MKYSAVVPLHNETDSVAGLWNALGPVLGRLDGPAEAVLVDDGSSDATLERLKNLRPGPVPLVIVSLKHRSGLSNALQAGFDHAQGGILITLDGDLQNDPADIPVLLGKLGEGFDVVFGWRRVRRDPVSKKIISWIGNRLNRLFYGAAVHDAGCNLRAVRREVTERIRLRSGLHRFFAVLAEREGFRVGEVAVTHHPRRAGSSKFGFWARAAQAAADFWMIRSIAEGGLGSFTPDYIVREVSRL